jgi:hypothetical protein
MLQLRDLGEGLPRQLSDNQQIRSAVAVGGLPFPALLVFVGIADGRVVHRAALRLVRPDG